MLDANSNYKHKRRSPGELRHPKGGWPGRRGRPLIFSIWKPPDPPQADVADAAVEVGEAMRDLAAALGERGVGVFGLRPRK